MIKYFKKLKKGFQFMPSNEIIWVVCSENEIGISRSLFASQFTTRAQFCASVGQTLDTAWYDSEAIQLENAYVASRMDDIGSLPPPSENVRLPDETLF
jgi:hypothetical protein